MALLVARYQIKLKDQSGTDVALLDSWRSLQFQRKINSAGFFTLLLNANDERVSLFEPDGQIEVWRSIPGVLDWQLEFEGHIENTDYTLFSNGNYQFSAIGSSNVALLGRRIIAYLDTSAGAAKGPLPADDVMKDYVDENIGPNATIAASSRLVDGDMAGFTVEADASAGDNWEGDRAGKNLLQVLQEIANFSEIDFDVVGTGAATYEFRTFEDQLGIDRTTEGLDSSTGLNGAGNVPHIFSPAYENVTKMRYSLTRRNEVNSVFMYGQGQGATRAWENQTDATAIAVSPIGLREAMRGGGSQSSAAELQDAGDEWLQQLQAVETFTFTPQDVEASLYGVHYDFGDKVTAVLDDIERDKRITAITFSVATGGEKKQIEFSDIPK